MLRNTILVAASCLLALLAGEIILRVWGFQSVVFDTYDPIRGKGLAPLAEGWYRDEGNAFVKINSHGNRDMERTFEKPGGAFRIAVLGDSFAFAREVDIEEAFWRVLERNLNSAGGLDGKKVEALNFGVKGYGTGQESLTFRHFAVKYNPDMVLLAFFPGNDFTDNYKPLADALLYPRGPSPYFYLNGGRLITDDSFKNNLSTTAFQYVWRGVLNLRVLQLINEGRRKLTARQIKGAPATEQGLANWIYREPSNADQAEAWKVTEALIAQLNEEVKKSGASLVMVIITTPSQVNPDKEKMKAYLDRLGVEDLYYPNKRLVKLGEKLGFDVIDLAPEMARMAEKRGIYFHGFQNTVMGTGHWNKDGHSAAAGIITERLTKKTPENPQ